MMKTLLCWIVFFAAATFARGQDVAFVAHPSVADGELSAAEVKSVLLGTKSNWSSGPIKLVVQVEGAVHEQVIQHYTQRSPDQFDKYWKKQVFTGKGTMPAQAKSDAEVISLVAATPGSFGYVTKSAVTDKVKVIQVK